MSMHVALVATTRVWTLCSTRTSQHTCHSRRNAASCSWSSCLAKVRFTRAASRGVWWCSPTRRPHAPGPGSFSVVQGFKLVAVPLCDLYGKHREYGPIIARYAWLCVPYAGRTARVASHTNPCLWVALVRVWRGVASIPHVISRFSLNLDVPALDDDAAMADDADAEAGKARDSAGAGAGGSEPAASAATGGASAGERGDQAPAPSQGATAEASASNGGKEAPALAPAPLAKVPPAPAAPQ